MRVCELMLRDLTSVDPDDSIRTLVETLEVSETSSVPVTDNDDRLVGVVSERDVLAAAVPRYMELLHSASFMPNLDQLAAGHDVLVLDNLSTGKLANVAENAKLERLDLCELGRVDARVNVLSSVNLLAAAARYGVRGIIFASSGGTVYGETPQPAPETSAKAPVSPYGAAKHSVEGYLFSFSVTGRFPGIALRYGNVYGPRQDPAGEAGVVLIFAGSLLRGGRSTIFGGGTAVRDYIMVADVVRANELAIEHLLTRDHTPATVDDAAFNTGTGVSTSVNELYDLIASCCGAEQSAEHVSPRAGELQESRLDIAKAGDVMRFDSQVPLREGIGEIVAWIAAHDTDAKS